jgi:hypothetical protein
MMGSDRIGLNKARVLIMKRLPLVLGIVLLGVIALLAALNPFGGVKDKARDAGTVASSPPEKLQEKKPIQWSDAEKKALDSITLSYDEVQKADAVLAIKTPDTLNTADQRVIVRAFERALAHAQSVPDGVLEKLHPEMKTQFREVYQAGLLRMLHGFKNGNINAARDGTELYQRYGEWLLAHGQELVFPTK